MEEYEGEFRALALLAIIVISTIGVGSLLITQSITVRRLGTIGTFVFGIFGVYLHFFSLPDEIEDSVHSVDIDTSETSGRVPDDDETGFDLTKEDIQLAKLEPKRVAQVISNSPNWYTASHGRYSTWLRIRLRRLFYSGYLSNRIFEAGLLIATAASYITLYFLIISFMPERILYDFIEPITDVYPTNQAMWEKQLVAFFCLALAGIGTWYFSIKSSSTCPVCNSPFSLESHKRYYKPGNIQVEQVETDKGIEEKEIVYGVHLFHCDSCGSWNVYSERWEHYDSY